MNRVPRSPSYWRFFLPFQSGPLTALATGLQTIACGGPAFNILTCWLFPAETEFAEWSAVHWWIREARCIFWNDKKNISGTMWFWTLFEIDMMMLMIAWEHSSITTLDFLCYMLQPEQYWTKLSWFTLTVPLFFFHFSMFWTRMTQVNHFLCLPNVLAFSL